jgi:septation ring formation regulator EzrA
MIEPTNKLIYELLKSMQGEMAEMRATLADHSQQFINIRDQLHTMDGVIGGLHSQIHDLKGDMLRLEKNQIAMKHDIERIKRRLDLVDAE